MIEFGSSVNATASASTHTSSTGSTAWKSRVVSNAQNMNVKVARDDAPSSAPIAATANASGERCARGITRSITMAKVLPMAALIMNIGASVPPDVPEPSDSSTTNAFRNKTNSTTPSTR